MKKIQVVLFIIIILRKIDCEIFSSVDRLEKLVSDEKNLLQELRFFANQVNDAHINRYLWKNESIFILSQ